TRSKTARLRLARRCAARWATSAASRVTAFRCRWMKARPTRGWIFPGAPVSSSKAPFRASAWASCPPSWYPTSSARCPTRWAPTFISRYAATTRTTWSRPASRSWRAACARPCAVRATRCRRPRVCWRERGAGGFRRSQHRFRALCAAALRRGSRVDARCRNDSPGRSRDPAGRRRGRARDGAFARGGIGGSPARPHPTGAWRVPRHAASVREFGRGRRCVPRPDRCAGAPPPCRSRLAPAAHGLEPCRSVPGSSTERGRRSQRLGLLRARLRGAGLRRDACHVRVRRHVFGGHWSRQFHGRAVPSRTVRRNGDGGPPEFPCPMSFQVIPAIDLRGGRVVRLRQGDYARETVFPDDPVELAQGYADAGAQWLHVVDLDGARSGQFANLAVIEAIARAGALKLQAGGGVRTTDDLRRLYAAGVTRVVVGSLAVQNPYATAIWITQFAPDRLVLALDVRRQAGAWRLPVHGWTEDSCVQLDTLAAHYARAGARHVLCTDIERDGTLGGFNLDLYRDLSGFAPGFEIQASGGA